MFYELISLKESLIQTHDMMDNFPPVYELRANILSKTAHPPHQRTLVSNWVSNSGLESVHSNQRFTELRFVEWRFHCMGAHTAVIILNVPCRVIKFT